MAACAPAPGLGGSLEEQKQCVCTRICVNLGVTRSQSFTEGWFTRIPGHMCPSVSLFWWMRICCL